MRASCAAIVLAWCTCMVQASSWDNVIGGGLLGAATGAVISEFSDDTDARYTIPLFASIGALTGYAIHEYRHHPSRHRADVIPYLALPYAWHMHQRSHRWRYRPATPIAVQQQKPPPPVNRHPGVTRVTIPITLQNGIVVPIQLFKTAKGYTGPRGESYEALPDKDALQQRYAP